MWWENTLFFLSGLVVGALLTLALPFFTKWVRKKLQSGNKEASGAEKRMPEVRHQTLTVKNAQKAGSDPRTKQRLSMEIPDIPMITLYDDTNQSDSYLDTAFEVQRRTTDSEMDKTCEVSSSYSSHPETPRTREDSEAVFEDWQTALHDICFTLRSLEKSMKGRKQRQKYSKCLLELEELEEHVFKEADMVGQMRNFLLDIQGDEGVQEDEREVAKWITTSFLNEGEDNTWAAAAENEGKEASALGSMTPSMTGLTASTPKLFQRFNSERIRSISSVSSINLQGDHTRDEDEKTLERNTEDPYAQYCFYQTQSTVLRVLEDLGKWEFDIFDVEEQVGNLLLPLLGVTICKKLKAHKLHKFHDLPEKIVFDYLLAITHSYHSRSEVSYHNALHAADVMCSSYSLILSEKFETFDHLQIVALILAAAAHDVNHDGYNNTFHINSGSKLALKYNDRSVLENHHCSVGWKLAMQPKHNLIKAMPREQRNTFRNIFISSILATDMTGHGGQLKTLGELHGVEKVSQPADQIRLLGHVLHSADISNVGKPFDYANVWVKLVMDEFFTQGDKEKDLNLPISPLCNRQKTDIDATEVGFIKFVVKPWFTSIAKVLPDRCKACLDNLNLNYRTFKDRALETQEMKNTNDERRSVRRSVLLCASDLKKDLEEAESSKGGTSRLLKPQRNGARMKHAFTDDDIDKIKKRKAKKKQRDTFRRPRTVVRSKSLRKRATQIEVIPPGDLELDSLILPHLKVLTFGLVETSDSPDLDIELDGTGI